MRLRLPSSSVPFLLGVSLVAASVPAPLQAAPPAPGCVLERLRDWIDLKRVGPALEELRRDPAFSAALKRKRIFHRDGHWLVRMSPAYVGEEQRVPAVARRARWNGRYMPTTYLTSERREWFRARAVDGYLVTSEGRRFHANRAEFVLDEHGDFFVFNADATREHEVVNLYHLHHSSFTAGGPVRSAGELRFGRSGEILSIAPFSGHYTPPQAVFLQVRPALEALGVKFEPGVFKTYSEVMHGAAKR